MRQKASQGRTSKEVTSRVAIQQPGCIIPGAPWGQPRGGLTLNKCLQCLSYDERRASLRAQLDGPPLTLSRGINNVTHNKPVIFLCHNILSRGRENEGARIVRYTIALL